MKTFSEIVGLCAACGCDVEWRQPYADLMNVWIIKPDGTKKSLGFGRVHSASKPRANASMPEALHEANSVEMFDPASDGIVYEFQTVAKVEQHIKEWLKA